MRLRYWLLLNGSAWSSILVLDVSSKTLMSAKPCCCYSGHPHSTRGIELFVGGIKPTFFSKSFVGFAITDYWAPQPRQGRNYLGGNVFFVFEDQRIKEVSLDRSTKATLLITTPCSNWVVYSRSTSFNIFNTIYPIWPNEFIIIKPWKEFENLKLSFYYFSTLFEGQLSFFLA